MTRGEMPIFETISGTYTATSVLGEGGAGRVYLATDEDGRQCAVKLVDANKLNKQRRKRFQNELTFGQRNTHPNILTVKDAGLYQSDTSNSPFYVMPRYAGSLREWMNQDIAPNEVLGIFAQILDGVEAAHLQNVVHRDLKPENILVDTDGRPVIADFGIAHFEQDDIYTAAETKAGERLANFHYAAPEQCERGATVDKRADIYALGLILNEIFTGRVPRGANYETVASTNAQYAYVDAVVEPMIRQNASERPASIEDVRILLRRNSDEFATQQRLSEISKTVISVDEIDDPLVTDPVRIVDVDYRNGRLILKLSHIINRGWMSAFQNMSGYSFLGGTTPQSVVIDNDTAIIPASEDRTQPIVDNFKQWLTIANRDYHAQLLQKKEEERRSKEEQLRQERAAIEQRERILKSIKF